MKFPPAVERYRIVTGEMASQRGDDFGMFKIPGPHGRELRVMASAGDERTGVRWEHVSVSLPTRCPNWPEMDFVKRLFWDDEETVMQLHPPRSQWISHHPHCLHLWRPWDGAIPLPPRECVGPVTPAPHVC